MWRSRSSQAKQLEAVWRDGEPSVYKKAVENGTLRFRVKQAADGEGFEPPVRFPVRQFSRLLP